MTINLDTTTRSLVAILSAATTTNGVDVLAVYSDNSATPSFGPGLNPLTITTNTEQPIVAAPAAGFQRVIKQVYIYNRDTVAATITFKIKDGAAYYFFPPITLAAGKGATLIATGGGSSGGASGHEIRVSGTALATEAAINFIGGIVGGRDNTVAGASEVYLSNPLFGGRLTLSSTLAIPTTDLTAQTTLYYLPMPLGGHNFLPIWDGTRWQMFNFSSLAGLTLAVASGSNYDVFLKWNGGTPVLILSAAWTNDTTRADALGLRDGISVLNADNTYVHLGTIRASALNACEDSEAKRFVSNLYNEVEYDDFRQDTTDSWINSGNGTWAAVDAGNAAWKHEFVRCKAGKRIAGQAHYSTSAGGAVTVVIDSTTTPDKNKAPYGVSNTVYTQIIADFSDYPSAGYHYIQALESTWTVASATSYGDNGVSFGGNAIGFNAGFRSKGWR